MNSLVVYLSSFLCFCLVFVLIKFFNRVWWTPRCMESTIRSQGVKGRPYKFLYGNAKEIMSMRNEAMTKPLELAHDQLLPRLQPHVYLWKKLYGMNFTFWYGPKLQIVVTEPELVKDMLNDKTRAYPKFANQHFAKKLLGDGLLLSDGEKWAKMRRLANFYFNGESLKGMIPVMVTSAEGMVERWKQNQYKEIEICKELRILTAEIIYRVAFGSSYLEGKTIFDMLMRLSVLIGRNNFKVQIPVLSKLFKTRDEAEADRIEQGMRDLIVNLMRKRDEELKKGKREDYGSDYFGLLLKSLHETDKAKKISVDDLIDECKTFYLAGQETTAASLSWTIMLLAINPDWQERARQEAIELFGQQHPSPDGIGRMKIMGMIINESLRLYPPVFNLLREVQRNVTLGNLNLPANMGLNISVLELHHNPKIWGEDAHQFKPERFGDGVGRPSNSSAGSAFLPFSAGPRNCAGLNFAVTEMKISLAMILRRYKITLSPTYAHSPIHVLTLNPQKGIPVVLQAI